MTPRRAVLARCAVLAWLLLLAVPAAAQNLIVNGGFSNNPPPNFGNNITWSVAPWQVGPGNDPNVVKVDNSATFNYGDSGPQHDASGNVASRIDYVAAQLTSASGALQASTPATARLAGQVITRTI